MQKCAEQNTNIKEGNYYSLLSFTRETRVTSNYFLLLYLYMLQYINRS